MAAGGRYGLLLALCGASLASAQGCDLPQAGASLGMERSQWREFDSAGRQLVKEDGWLRTVVTEVQTACAGWLLQGRLAHAEGGRDYAGFSNNGAALQTSSGIRRNRLQFEVWRPLSTRSDGPAVGGRVGWTVLDRNIAGVGNVLGYPEQFRYLQAAVGARYAWPDVAGLRFGMEGWLGGGPAGRVTLRLPGLDEASLPLGSSRTAQLGVSLAPARADPDEAGWDWHLRLDLRHERTRAGKPRPLYRHGLLYGGAVQPAFRQTAIGLEAGLLYRF